MRDTLPEFNHHSECSKKDHHLCLILFSIFNKLIGKRNLVFLHFFNHDGEATDMFGSLNVK